MAIVHPATDVRIPTLVCVDGEKVCACDMCFSPKQGIVNRIGPHDYNCLCNSCCEFAMNSKSFFDSMNVRYPELSSIVRGSPEDHEFLALVDQGFRGFCFTQNCPYHAPPNSPTNQEMHALNGNLSHQHHHGYGDFVRAAARGIAGSRNPADQFAAVGGGASAALFGGLSYAAQSNMSKPLNELYEQWTNPKVHNPNAWNKAFHNGPSNKDMHSYNGNLWSGRDYQPNIPHNLNPHPRREPTPAPVVVNPTVKPLPTISERAPEHSVITDLTGDLAPNPGYQKDHSTPQIPVTTAPTNKDMHATNGNIYGPANKGVTSKRNKVLLRRLKRKLNKAKKKPKIVIKTKPTVRKSTMPKKARKVVTKEEQARRLALYYASRLRNPGLPFPRLGSTGELPTKILHGFYEFTFQMAAPGFGGVPALTNCTDLIVFLSPKMFAFSSGAANFSGPINIGVAINSVTAFTNVAATSSFACADFNNMTALKNETGATLSTSDVPAARVLGGHISVICRCPMSTTAPPFMYAGLLPQNLATNSGVSVNFAAQLNAQTSAAIRGLTTTAEVPGFEASAKYIPSTTKNLDFSPNVVSYQSGNVMELNPIPYVGMTGCPTTANVTILASVWYEVEQTTSNMLYGGFGIGPKLEAENVFDFLPRINPVESRAFPIGTKASTGNSMSVMAQLAANLKPHAETAEEKLDKVMQQYEILKQSIKSLRIDTDSSDEDEKYFEDENVVRTTTVDYKNLSKSTIDLALSLKDKLTPGSVTSKTSRSSLP